MKAFYILTLGLLLSLSYQPQVMAQGGSSQEVKFYNSSNHRGSSKTMRMGTYNNVNNWRYNSYKLNEYCCIKFYYYNRRGKISEKKVCGSKRDFKSLIRGWDTKFGWSKGWKNIKYIEVYCQDRGGETASNNNSNNNRNTGGGRNVDIRRGHFVLWNNSGYGGNHREFDDREQNCRNWNYYSGKIHRDCYLKVWYNKRSGKGEKELRGDFRDLRDVVRNWGLKHGHQNPWRSIYKVRLYCGGGNATADRGGNRNNSNTGGGRNVDIRRGHFVLWNNSGYGGNHREFDDREQNCRNWNYYSGKIHRDCYLKVWYNKRSGKGEKELRGDFKDLRNVVRNWGLKHGHQNPWRSIYKVRLYCGNDRANGDRRNEANGGGGAPNVRTGYGAFFAEKGYRGTKLREVPRGNRVYKQRDLKNQIPGSFYMRPNSGYLVIKFKKYGGGTGDNISFRQDSYMAKESVKDMYKLLYDLTGYDENDPKWARTHFKTLIEGFQYIRNN